MVKGCLTRLWLLTIRLLALPMLVGWACLWLIALLSLLGLNVPPIQPIPDIVAWPAWVRYPLAILWIPAVLLLPKWVFKVVDPVVKGWVALLLEPRER